MEMSGCEKTLSILHHPQYVYDPGGDQWDGSTVPWEYLPNEVLWKVLSHVPARDLLSSATIVSHNWSHIIQHHTFWRERVSCNAFQESPPMEEPSGVIQEHETVMLRFLQALCLYKEDPYYLQHEMANFVGELQASGEYTIQEEELQSATVLLIFKKPQIIQLHLKSDPSTLQGLSLLLKVLSRSKSFLYISDNCSWRTVQSSSNDIVTFLKTNSSKCVLKSFHGCLNSLGINALPNTLTSLNLALTNTESAYETLTTLNRATLPCLQSLGIHIVACSISPNDLTQIRDVKHKRLYISNLSDGDEQWLAQATAMCAPQDGFTNLIFPNCGLSVLGIRLAVQYLSEARIHVSQRIQICSPLLNWESLKELDRYTYQLLNCDLHRYEYAEDLTSW